MSKKQNDSDRYSELTPEERRILEDRRMHLLKIDNDQRQDQRRRICQVCSHEMKPGQKEIAGVRGVSYPAMICPNCGDYKFIETVGTRITKIVTTAPEHKKMMKLGGSFVIPFPRTLANAMGIHEVLPVEIKIEGLNKIGVYFHSNEEIPVEVNDELEKLAKKKETKNRKEQT